MSDYIPNARFLSNLKETSGSFYFLRVVYYSVANVRTSIHEFVLFIQFFISFDAFLELINVINPSVTKNPITRNTVRLMLSKSP